MRQSPRHSLIPSVSRTVTPRSKSNRQRAKLLLRRNAAGFFSLDLINTASVGRISTQPLARMGTFLRGQRMRTLISLGSFAGLIRSLRSPIMQDFSVNPQAWITGSWWTISAVTEHRGFAVEEGVVMRARCDHGHCAF